MTTTRSHTWQEIQERIRANISNRIWSPGELIPGEVELAEQYGCARTTVNRALRELASTGIVERKRKAGTRVALQRARRVTAEIPVIRAQIEEQGMAYRFSLIKNEFVKPGSRIKNAMQLKNGCKALHIRSVHYADDAPFIYEDRWINTQTISEIKKIDLSKTSANEWLVQYVPFTSGEFVVEACSANKTVAKALGLNHGDPVLCSSRATWLEELSVTQVNLYYASGYQMRFEI